MTTEAKLRKLAEGQSAAYVQLLERGEGVGGLDTDKFDAMIAWDDASENGHADVVLGLLDKLDEARAVIKILEGHIRAGSRGEHVQTDGVERLAYLITAFRFKERGLRGAIREPDISIARPMAEFLSREGYRLLTEVESKTLEWVAVLNGPFDELHAALVDNSALATDRDEWRGRAKRAEEVTDEKVDAADRAYTVAMNNNRRPWSAMRAALRAAAAADGGTK